jgi:serine/threonine protein kinase
MKDIFNIPKLNLANHYSPCTNIISPFIDEGEFLEHRPPINRNYSIDNFEYITDCNKEIITIGKGGYGKLYLARNKKDNKEYAIKYVSKKKMQSVGVDYSIIKREIDIHIRITHPRIIKLLSYLEDRYNFYLAMEYAPKGTLYQLIQQKRGMCENEAFYYFIQVASAIHFLHENGYAHRDIKPENILLDGKGGIKLCDFGWCVNVAKGERTTFCGTYEYMAPEMINDEFYDMGIDIWSLGVLLYEMIHGYSPFRASRFVKDAKKAQVEIFINIKNNNYTINKKMSKECIDLIDKLLTTDTKKRIKIDQLFMHPWVVNKEKEYFPFFKRYKEIETSNEDMSSSNRRLETDIDCIKSLDLKIRNAELFENSKYNQGIYVNKGISDKREKEKKIEKNNTSKHIKNKSYCFVYTKGNSLNNGIYFIQGNSGNKNNREDKISKEEKEKDRNNYEFNKITLTETNQDLINKNKKNELSPLIQKKEVDAKNNFVYSINSRRKKINLPRVIRTEKKEAENNRKLPPHENQEVKALNKKLNEKSNIKPEQKLELRNYSKPKNDKKAFIRVQRQELDDYIKRQNEINDLNLKMEKIKEKQELVISKLRKIEEKKRREESLQKLYDSQKSNTSFDYFSKTKRLKNQFSYVNYKPKKEIGSYSIKQFAKEKDNKNRILNIKEKAREKRSKSFQQLLTEKTLENKIKALLKEKKIKNKTNNTLNSLNANKIYMNNKENSVLRNMNNNKGEDDISIKENFKRFRKMVVHLKKRNNLNTDGNLYKSCNMDKEKNKSENKLIKTKYPKIYMKSSKANKSIQNIFYNTFFNCLFNNEQNNNSNIKNFNSNNNVNINNNNIYEQKNNILSNQKEFKSISSEKNIFKYKKLFELKTNKKEYENNLNKINDLVNYSSERKRGKIFIHPPRDEKNINEKDKSNYLYLNYKNHLIKSSKIHFPSNKKEIIA